MARFYGTVDGNLAKTNATRRGSDYIKASAQSWHGSVITQLNYDNEGMLIVKIGLTDDSSSYGSGDFYGTFEELKQCFAEWKEIRKEKA